MYRVNLKGWMRMAKLDCEVSGPVPLNELEMADALFGLLRHASNYDIGNPEERLRSNKDLDRLFHSLMLVFKPDLFVECGAYFAETSLRVKERLPDTRVVAFEANPYNFEMCSNKIDYAAAGVEYLHMALSSTEGSSLFSIQVARGGEPMSRTNGQSSFFERVGPGVAFESVDVPTTTLDAFFCPAPKRSVLWIDIEGAAGLVLPSARGILDTCDMLFIEVEDRALWKGQWLTLDIVRFLGQFGLYPIARDFESPSRIQYNMIFIKRKYLLNRHVWRHVSEFNSYSAFPSSKITIPHE